MPEALYIYRKRNFNPYSTPKGVVCMLLFSSFINIWTRWVQHLGFIFILVK